MHVFDLDISLEEQEPFLFLANLSDHWSVNGFPNGGYLMALLANAMRQKSEKKFTLIITANYISRCSPGNAHVMVEAISQSTQFDRLEAKLMQGGKERIRAIGTFANWNHGQTEKRYETSEPKISPITACIPIPRQANYSLFQQLDIRLDPACAGWLEDKLAEKSEQKGWVKFREDRPFDMLSVLLAADSFPPPVLASHGRIAWLPTIEYSVNMRNIPQSIWLICVFRTRFIHDGILESDGEIWEEGGELVSISRQIAQLKKTDSS